MKSTIKTATKNLKPELARVLRNLWDCNQAMDLDYGSVEAYMQVVLQGYEQTKERLRDAELKLEQINKLSGKGNL